MSKRVMGSLNHLRIYSCASFNRLLIRSSCFTLGFVESPIKCWSWFCLIVQSRVCVMSFYPWYQGEMNDVFCLSNSSDLPLYLHPIEIPKLEDLLSLLIRSLVIKPSFLMIWSWWISFLMGWLEKIMRKSWANDYV